MQAGGCGQHVCKDTALLGQHCRLVCTADQVTHKTPLPGKSLLPTVKYTYRAIKLVVMRC